MKVSAIIRPNRISEILSIGSSIRSDDLAQNGASGSTAVWIGSFSIPVTDDDAPPVPIHLTAETIESGGPVEAPDLFRSATPENGVAIDLDLRDSPMKSRCRRPCWRRSGGAARRNDETR